MFFVNRPVHANSGLEVVQLPVVAYTIGDGGQGGGAETSRARGDGVAAHSHDAGVDFVPLQTQLGQDVFNIFQTVFLSERNGRKQKGDRRVEFPVVPLICRYGK